MVVQIRLGYSFSLITGWKILGVGCTAKSLVNFTTKPGMLCHLDNETHSVLALLTRFQSATDFLGTTTFRAPVLGDPRLLKKSGAVDVMMLLSSSVSSLMSMHVPSTLTL